jgi:hypothetical protein
VTGFNTFDNDIQQKILQTLTEKLKGDQALFQRALDRQVRSSLDEAKTQYESKNHLRLLDILEDVTPVAAILINIELSLLNLGLQEEGGTLALTLLPYLNQVTDYSFMEPDASFIASRFLASLARHIMDVKETVDVGFMAFGLKYDPTRLRQLVCIHNHQSRLVDALKLQGFSVHAAAVIVTHPSKLLWPELLKFFKGKTP